MTNLPTPHDLFGDIEGERERREAVSQFLMLTLLEQMEWLRDNRSELFVCEVRRDDDTPDTD